MTPTPQNLAQSMAEEITAEVGNALEPEDRKRFCEHIEKHIIQRRIEPIAQLVDENRWRDASLEKPGVDAEGVPERVIVFVPRFAARKGYEPVVVGRWHESFEQWRIDGSPSDWEVTWWRPFPTAPKQALSKL